ncbi:MAG TPA: glycosyltransferase [Longimicrobiales bacterium]|nr:glycosyltransferase [Longimicrobiales bacterium]
MTDLPDLVLLTATFPFGNKSETFLEAEMEVLSGRFERIFVLPSSRESGVRPLPSNAELVEMPWLREPGRGARWRALASSDAAGVLAWTLRRRGNWVPYAGSARMYLDILARNVLKARELRSFVEGRGLSGAVFYDYWFENSTVALALLRREGAVGAAVCRAHGFDVYDERWGGRPVPFREFKLSGMDLVAPVSEFGARYLEARAPRQAHRIRVHRLGVRAQGSPAVVESGPPLVLSCGSLLPGKRVHLIPEALGRLGRPLRWMHFGDGPEREKVKAAAERLPGEVAWKLAGHVDNAQVLDFYRQHRVEALLSFSESEGLPVSMMEAISFGVPIVAIGVHGVPEIVNEATGVLLRPDAGPEEMAAGIAHALEPGRFDSAGIRGFFRKNFDAGFNYNRFVDALIALRQDQAPRPR